MPEDGYAGTVDDRHDALALVLMAAANRRSRGGAVLFQVDDLGAMRAPNRVRVAELRPRLHHLLALLEEIAAPIRRLDLVVDRVRHRYLDRGFREPGAFVRPILESRPEAVRHDDLRIRRVAVLVPHAPDEHEHRLIAHRPAWFLPRE